MSGASRYTELREELAARPRRWLVTGAAGFIGSHLAEELLALGQEVRGLDNFATGHTANLDDVRERAGAAAWRRFELIRGDVIHAGACVEACRGADFVLHQAALGSVPKSIDLPLDTHASNVTGTLNMLLAARDAQVRRFVYASSSAVYGEDPELPKREARLGAPLSPYAASKRISEIYAEAFRNAYGTPAVGLRYFNVYGPRQDPAGAYAAVIPRWVDALLRGEQPILYGDGATTRDFCHVANVVQANLLAAFAPESALGRVFNVALGQRTSLLQLYRALRDGLARLGVPCAGVDPLRLPARSGDVQHSVADIGLAREQLGYAPGIGLEAGLDLTLRWYCGRAGKRQPA
ncbi:MAG: SDR family oxidoreductase [Planctomycetota bacterium]|nr:MAG: SDR family oxidoreductase [Planctomycetota bacterium]